MFRLALRPSVDPSLLNFRFYFALSSSPTLFPFLPLLFFISFIPFLNFFSLFSSFIPRMSRLILRPPVAASVNHSLLNFRFYFIPSSSIPLLFLFFIPLLPSYPSHPFVYSPCVSSPLRLLCLRAGEGEAGGGRGRGIVCFGSRRTDFISRGKGSNCLL